MSHTKSRIATRSRSSTQFFALLGALTLLFGVEGRRSEVRAEVLTWNNPAGGSWNLAANWNPENVPDQSGEEALFVEGDGTYLVVLNLSPTLDRITVDDAEATLDISGRTLTLLDPAGLHTAGILIQNSGVSTINGNVDLASSGELHQLSGSSVYLSGPLVSNAGKIYINFDGGYSNALLRTQGDVSLGGTGEIILSTAGSTGDAQLGTTGGILTQGMDHVIRGEGNISGALANEGLIDADVPGRALLLSGGAKTNNGTIRARDGGWIQISSGAITQGTSGTLLADAGTVELLSGAAVNGGSFTTSNGGEVTTNTGIVQLTDVSNLGLYEILGGTSTYVYGSSLPNEGTISINPDQSTSNTVLWFYDDVTLAGDGEVVLRINSTDLGDAQIGSSSATATQAAGHTIRGEGTISAALINEGLIEADLAGRELLLSSRAKINRGTIRAIGGGIVSISSGAITQEAGGTISADGGIVRLLSGARITGGSVNSSIGGVVTTDTGIVQLTDVAGTGVWDLVGGTSAYVYGSTFQNDGTLTVNRDSSTSNTVLWFYDDVSLQGAGEVVLQTAGSIVDAQIGTSAATLTHAASHTIRGEGTISAVTINDGVIRADVEGRELRLSSGSKTNHGTIQAVGGGILSISSGAIAQGETGLVLADSGRVQLLSGSSVTGGSLASANGGIVEAATGISTLTNVTNLGTYHIMGAASTYLRGSFFGNDGSVAVNANGSDSNTYLWVYEDIVLRGTGEVVLQTNGATSDAQLGSSSATLTNGTDHTIRGEGTVSAALVNQGLVDADSPGRTLLLNSQSKVNVGALRASNGGFLDVSSAGFVNSGVVEARSGGIVRANVSNHYSGGVLLGGTWAVFGDSEMRLTGANITELRAGLVLDGSGSDLHSDDGSTDALAGFAAVGYGGLFRIQNARDYATPDSLDCFGEIEVGPSSTLTVSGLLTQKAGQTRIDGVLATAEKVAIEGGSLAGSGTVNAFVENGWSVQPGSSAGQLTIDGDYEQLTTGSLDIEIGGRAEGEYDRLVVTGNAVLSGQLHVEAIEDFEVEEGDSFVVMAFASREGEFDEVVACPGPGLCGEVIYTDTSVTVVIHQIAPSDVPEPGEAPVGLPDQIRLAARPSGTGGTVFALDLPLSAGVELSVFDVRGRRVATILRGREEAGRHEYRWGGEPSGGSRLGSGVYFARAVVRSAEGAEERRSRFVLVR